MQNTDAHYRILLLATILLFIALLIAGLWPFQFITTNHAVYSKTTGCLLCDRFSSAYLPICLDSNRPGSGLPFTIEGRLSFTRGARYPYFARILAIFDHRTGTEVIAAGQFNEDLVVRVRKRGNTSGLPITAEQTAESFFTNRSHGSIIVRIEPGMAAVSVGDRVMEFNNPVLPDSARIVIGNSAWGDSPWSGEICLGLKEGTGVAEEPVVVVPRFFQPLVRTALSPIRRDFVMSKWYARDIALNVAGFVPFGFLLVLLLYRKFRLSLSYAAGVGIGIGCSTSLIIELLQVLLPYRSSQMSDVICNTLGTVCGVTLFLIWKAFRYRFTAGRT